MRLDHGAEFELRHIEIRQERGRGPLARLKDLAQGASPLLEVQRVPAPQVVRAIERRVFDAELTEEKAQRAQRACRANVRERPGAHGQVREPCAERVDRARRGAARTPARSLQHGTELLVLTTRQFELQEAVAKNEGSPCALTKGDAVERNAQGLRGKAQEEHVRDKKEPREDGGLVPLFCQVKQRANCVFPDE